MAVTISKPTVNGSNNTWGATINSGLDTIANAFNGVIETTPDLGTGFKINGTTVNVGSAELDLLDGATAATVVNDKVVVYGAEGQVKVNQVFEAVTTDTSTTGTINFDVNTQAVMFFTANQTTDRTINFRGDSTTTLNDTLAVGESATFAVAATQGSTAYYLNAYQIDGTTVTPKWSGGTAPAEGNASGIDVYTFTIIKTASATYTVLAGVTQYA
jgi:hypothetical protein